MVKVTLEFGSVDEAIVALDGIADDEASRLAELAA